MWKKEHYRVSIEQVLSKKVLEERQTAFKVHKYSLAERPGLAVTIKVSILMIKKTCNDLSDTAEEPNDFIDSISKLSSYIHFHSQHVAKLYSKRNCRKGTWSHIHFQSLNRDFSFCTIINFPFAFILYQ